MNLSIQRALLSVSDKTGLFELATALVAKGVEIISTGGTANYLREKGITVTSLESVTNFPEILDGRVKTLHPKIYGGILANHLIAEHNQALQEHSISPIDVVVVNLYPFEETVKKSTSTHEHIIENIDIGGPSMVRASAKNYLWTTILTNPQQYGTFLEYFNETASIPEEYRLQLAKEAFQHTAYYDAKISQYFETKTNETLPTVSVLGFKEDFQLRYGENNHQNAKLYGEFSTIFNKLHGKDLSYNNIVDTDSASKLCAEFEEPTCVIIKHNNPCGVGSSTDLITAFEKAFSTDVVSPFGGIIAVNREVDVKFAQRIESLFLELLVAPNFTPEALEYLRKKKDRRIVTVDYDQLRKANVREIKSVSGGVLIQENDNLLYDSSQLRCVTERMPTEDEQKAMQYALKIAKHVKSNAIVYASADHSLAIGAGQMSRVDSARIAVLKAKEAGISLKGSAVASDAFFPFADGLMQAVEAGATSVIQPGGSKRDDEVIDAANQHNITMMFTGIRHFKH
jgi:phosphoribosylaminoimidazolecarboxamide formyltransferase/IMP cyclohydrolase